MAKLAEKSKVVTKNCKHFVKSLDIYGNPIGLTCKQESSFKSVIGGFGTIIS